MARLSFRCDEELVRRVDAARGDVARERWLRRQVERALDAQPEFVPASTHNALAEAARQGYRVSDEWGLSAPLSSSQAKRDVHPIPKKEKR